MMRAPKWHRLVNIITLDNNVNCPRHPKDVAKYLLKHLICPGRGKVYCCSIVHEYQPDTPSIAVSYFGLIAKEDPAQTPSIIDRFKNSRP